MEPPPAKRRKTTWWQAIGSPTKTLAPLVDQSELAFRLLCRARGAELCSTPMFDARRFAGDAAYRAACFGAAEGGPAATTASARIPKCRRRVQDHARATRRPKDMHLKGIV